MSPAATVEGEGGLTVHLNRPEDGPEAELAGLEELEPLLERAVRATVDAAEAGGRGEISVTFLPLDAMATLNQRYLDRAGPTDVLAFDLGGEEGGLLGDVYVAPEMARRAAREGEAEDLREEMVRLTVHGVLHVLGHEHPEDDERWESPMFRLQERLVEELAGAGGDGP